MYVRIYVCMYVCNTCLSAYMINHSSTHPSTHPLIPPSTHPSSHPSTHSSFLSLHLFLHLSIHPSTLFIPHTVNHFTEYIVTEEAKGFSSISSTPNPLHLGIAMAREAALNASPIFHSAPPTGEISLWYAVL